MFLRQDLCALFSVTQLVNASHYHLDERFGWAGEAHDFWEIVYIDRGEAIVRADDTRFLLKQGEMTFHAPNEFHSIATRAGRSAEVIILAFVCQSEAMRAFARRIINLTPMEKQCLSAAVREAEDAYLYFDNQAPRVRLVKREDARPGSEQIIRTSIEQLLIHAYRSGEQTRREARIMASNAINHHAALAAESTEFLKRRYREKITLSRLAAAVGVSTSQLKRVFREQVGVSVVTYLTELRIRAAKRLIREQQLNFTQIAEATGFDNIYYFSYRFKQHTGMTPTQYARSVRDGRA